ncbi:hypothetical protein EVB41_018 [Rhizobium phage RHph_TM3_14A]|nr:hypothetical protein EVB41_018 [Rhizobium phage RHph_TM3_14A]
MNSALSLPPGDDLDASMRLVARNLAMGIYPLPKILEDCGIKPSDFHRWKEHPRFLGYLKSETEAWNSAQNTPERTKLKAGIVMEEWITDAYLELKDRKQPLNHRVELGKLVAKIAGMGESVTPFGAGSGGGGGFSLQINISPGHSTTINARPVVEDAEFSAVEEEKPTKRRIMRPPSVIPEEPDPPFFEEDDGYDPLVSPDTLGDLNV